MHSLAILATSVLALVAIGDCSPALSRTHGKGRHHISQNIPSTDGSVAPLSTPVPKAGAGTGLTSGSTCGSPAAQWNQSSFHGGSSVALPSNSNSEVSHPSDVQQSGTGQSGVGKSGTATPPSPTTSGVVSSSSQSLNPQSTNVGPVNSRPVGSSSGFAAPTNPSSGSLSTGVPSSGHSITNPAVSSNVNGSSGGAKGAGIWSSSGVAAAVTEIGASWTYDWGPTPNDSFGGSVPAGVETVPMFAKGTTDDAASNITSSPRHVLGWNEPDVGSNGPDSATAISAWPSAYSALSNGGNCRIGSPAPAHTTLQSGDWFYDFMQGINNQVDFIALHYYSPSFSDVAGGVAELQKYIEGVYAVYNKPIWLTEYAMVDFTSTGSSYGSVPGEDVQQDFMKQSVQMLDQLVSQGIVERYAWFALPQSSAQPASNLMDSDGQLNALGQVYKSM